MSKRKDFSEIADADEFMAEYFRRFSNPEEREELLAEQRLRIQNRMTREEVADLLGVTLKMLVTFDLRTYDSPEHTDTGFRMVPFYQLPELVEFVRAAGLPSYSPLDGPLLSPDQVVSLARENGRELTTRSLSRYRKENIGPRHASLGPRIKRYRHRDVIEWAKPVAISDLLMSL